MTLQTLQSKENVDRSTIVRTGFEWLVEMSLFVFVGCEQCSVTEHFSKKQNSARFSVKIIAWKCLEIFDHNVNLTLWDSQTIYTELTTGL